MKKDEENQQRLIEKIRYVEMQTDLTKIHKEISQLIVLELYLCQPVHVDLLQVSRVFLQRTKTMITVRR